MAAGKDPSSRGRLRRVLAAGLVVVAIALGPAAPTAAAAPSAVAAWSPRTVNATQLAGRCPTAVNPAAACPLERGVRYETTVSVGVAGGSGPLLVEADGAGLEIVAFSAATGTDVTRPLADGGVEPIRVAVTIPPAERGDRGFYIGRVRLVGGDAVRGSLLISLVVPKARLTWARPTDPADGRPILITTDLMAGESVEWRVALGSNVALPDVALRAADPNLTVVSAPTSLAAGTPAEATLAYRAPVVSRDTRATLTVTATSRGRPVDGALRVRLRLRPARLSWSPPRVEARAEPVAPRIVAVAVTSSVDAADVEFRSADLGLAPVVAPAEPVDLTAGVPQMVALELCPGYAATTYFLNVVGYVGHTPLPTILPLRVRVPASPQSSGPIAPDCGRPREESRDDLFNCADFPSRAAAQRFLTDHPGDPSRLDADHDGLACEAGVA